MTNKKLKIGVFSVTGCAGCQLSMIFNEDELLSVLEIIDLHAFPFIKGVNPDDDFDCVFMEGLVATMEDLELLQKIRKNTKYLVALGACAHTGCIPAYRNFMHEKVFDKTFHHTMSDIVSDLKSIEPSSIDTHVKVDFTIPGCPPEKEEIIDFIRKVSQGIEPRMYKDPVCLECRKRGNRCLLEDNKPCLGSIIQGGCKAVCPSSGFECWGCRGLTEDANIKALYDLLREKGFSKADIKKRMLTFLGTKTPKDIDTLFRKKSQK